MNVYSDFAMTAFGRHVTILYHTKSYEQVLSNPTVALPLHPRSSYSHRGGNTSDMELKVL
jgi:hypothetical protein